MAKPPAGSSLLFGALVDSGQIKQRKNGGYRMVLEGVDEINWFTDRPNRVEGVWKPQKILQRWDKYFTTSEPNAPAGFRADGKQEMVTFEMFNPKIKSGKMMFNIKPISDSGKDKLTGQQDRKMSDISLFIDDATTPCLRTVTLRLSSNSGLPVTMRSLSSNAKFGKAVDVTGNADLSPKTWNWQSTTPGQTDIYFNAGGQPKPAQALPESENNPLGTPELQNSKTIIEIPITLTMGITESKFSFERSRGIMGFNGLRLNCSGNPITAEISYSIDGEEKGTINVPCAGLNEISPTINWGKNNFDK